jgi:DNA-binding transcriptional MerR regulator
MEEMDRPAPSGTKAAEESPSSQGPSVPASIEVRGKRVFVHDLQLEGEELSGALLPLDPPGREAHLKRVIEVGVYCLERAGNVRDLDFVRHQVRSLLEEVEGAVRSIPESLGSQLASRLGTDPGQVLAPVRVAVDAASEATHRRIREVEDLLRTEINPGNEASSLGRALRSIQELLDPRRTDSVQAMVGEAVRQLSGPEGDLAGSVKSVVQETVRPLVEQVNALTQRMATQQGAESVIQMTPLKGPEYEEHVVRLLQGWARWAGAQVEHVGPDNGPGDVVVTLSSGGLTGKRYRLAVEVKDRTDPQGRRVIQSALSRVMQARQCQAALWVSRSPEGFAQEIGDWAEGELSEGPWVACTEEHLVTGLRFLMALLSLKSREDGTSGFPADQLRDEVRRLRDGLNHLRNIRTKVTNVRDLLDQIDGNARDLRQAVEESLDRLERALRASAEGQGTLEGLAGG